MSEILKLWSVPTLTGKYKHLNGVNLIGLINHHHKVVQDGVKYEGWQLSPYAKDMLAEKEREEKKKMIINGHFRKGRENNKVV